MKKTIFIAILVALSVVSTAQINQITSVSGYLTFSGSDANKYYTYMPTGNKIYIFIIGMALCIKWLLLRHPQDTLFKQSIA